MKKPIPLHEIVARLRRMSLEDRIARLRTMVALERPYSVRRNELESLLTGAVTRQLRRENRAA